MNPANTDILLSEYKSNLHIVHYILFNLFRVLRPMRLKYKLTISELVILSGIYCFSRHQATLFSLPMIKRYISYYNYNKARYYIGSLVDKGVICISDFRRDQPLYKLTDKGIEVLNAYQDAYNIAMAKYFQDNNIEL